MAGESSVLSARDSAARPAFVLELLKEVKRVFSLLPNGVGSKVTTKDEESIASKSAASVCEVHFSQKVHNRFSFPRAMIIVL